MAIINITDTAMDLTFVDKIFQLYRKIKSAER